MINKLSNPSTSLSESQISELSTLKERFNLSLIEIMNTTKKYTANLDLLTIWPDTNNLSALYEQLSELKTCLDNFRPFNSSMLKNLN